ncbi:hypothetical protein DIPPA_23463 [Diplonema papillatum]|nr:hypothetical protein DIPPA_23463 [Diplonema papillatum]
MSLSLPWLLVIVACVLLSLLLGGVGMLWLKYKEAQREAERVRRHAAELAAAKARDPSPKESSDNGSPEAVYRVDAAYALSDRREKESYLDDIGRAVNDSICRDLGEIAAAPKEAANIFTYDRDNDNNEFRARRGAAPLAADRVLTPCGGVVPAAEPDNQSLDGGSNPALACGTPPAAAELHGGDALPHNSQPDRPVPGLRQLKTSQIRLDEARVAEQQVVRDLEDGGNPPVSTAALPAQNPPAARGEAAPFQASGRQPVEAAAAAAPQPQPATGNDASRPSSEDNMRSPELSAISVLPEDWRAKPAVTTPALPAGIPPAAAAASPASAAARVFFVVRYPADPEVDGTCVRLVPTKPLMNLMTHPKMKRLDLGSKAVYLVDQAELTALDLRQTPLEAGLSRVAVPGEYVAGLEYVLTLLPVQEAAGSRRPRSGRNPSKHRSATPLGTEHSGRRHHSRQRSHAEPHRGHSRCDETRSHVPRRRAPSTESWTSATRAGSGFSSSDDETKYVISSSSPHSQSARLGRRRTPPVAAAPDSSYNITRSALTSQRSPYPHTSLALSPDRESTSPDSRAPRGRRPPSAETPRDVLMLDPTPAAAAHPRAQNVPRLPLCAPSAGFDRRDAQPPSGREGSLGGGGHWRDRPITTPRAEPALVGLPVNPLVFAAPPAAFGQQPDRAPASLPWCRAEGNCFDVNDEAHYTRFRHFCRIPYCSLAADPDHDTYFSHDYPRENMGGGGGGGAPMVADAPAFGYVDDQTY